MTAGSTDRQAHWQRVYQNKDAETVSWHRPQLDTSLELLELAGLSPETRLLDVGAGASTLVDDLLARGLREITVLDISAEALAVARQRLAARAGDVTWLTADLLSAARDIAAMLGQAFELVDERRERHLSPGGVPQSFAYALLRRR